MIPALLIWLYNRYATTASKKRASNVQTNDFKKTTKPMMAVLPILFFLTTASASQERTVNYRVVHNGNVIGQMLFQQKTEGQDVFLKMSSSVSTRFVFGIKVHTIDEARFRNGKLLSSSVYRNVNGKEKESKKTKWVDSYYQMQSGSKTRTVSNPIFYNMMLLYCQEPVGRSVIYSDNFQQFLPVKKIAAHVYRIELPDGNHNDYHFQNGLCSLVEIHHSLYTIKMELV